MPLPEKERLPWSSPKSTPSSCTNSSDVPLEILPSPKELENMTTKKRFTMYNLQSMTLGSINSNFN